MVFLRAIPQVCYERIGVLLVQVGVPMCYSGPPIDQPVYGWDLRGCMRMGMEAHGQCLHVRISPNATNI